nr:MAG TPA: minor tail protein [Caudoviricetes sp.]
MVEELKLAIKIDDVSIEQSLLKQFTNAQKMADKVVLDFKNVNFDDKQIEAKFKEMQKKAGQNPIDLTINGNTLDMLGQIDKKLTEIFSIGKGKSFIDSSSITAEANKTADSIKKNFTDSINSVKSEFESLKSEIAEVENAYNKIKRNKYEQKESKYIDNHSNDYVDLSKYSSTSNSKSNFDYLEKKLKEIYSLYNNVNTAIEHNGGWFNGIQYNSSDLNQIAIDFKSLAQAYYELDREGTNKSLKAIADILGEPAEKIKTLKQVTSKMSDEFKDFVTEVINDSDKVKENNKLFNEETQQLIKENEKAVNSYLESRDKLLSRISDKDARNKIQDYLPYINKDFPDFSDMENFGSTIWGDSVDVLKEMCNILGIEIPNSVDKATTALNETSIIESQEKVQSELKETQTLAEKTVKAVTDITSTPQESNILSTSTPAIEQQIKSESELNAEIEKRENIIRELQQLQEKLTVHEDFHGNDRYFADQLPTEEEIREADKRIKQLTGTNNIFDVDKLIQDRNEWLSEVKYSLEEYDDLIKANNQKALDEYTTRGLSRIGGAESFFGYEDNNFSIASKFVEEKEKIQNEINDLYVDLDKLDEKMNFDSNNSSIDNTVQSQEKLQSELKETQEQAEKTAQAVKEVASATASTEQKKDAFPGKDVSASVESATNSIKEENNALDQNTQKVKENTQAKEQNANVNLNKYDKRLDSYNGKIDKYKTTIDRFNDGGWTSSTYLENVQAVKNAVKEYETLLNELKGKDASLVTSEDIAQLDKYEKKIKDTIATVTNMSASEKGYNFVSSQKELDKIHKLLAENSKMSSEAKAKIRAYYVEIESGNPSMSLDKIHGEILKIYNAEVEAGRAGRTLWDTLKNSGFHQIAAQMAGMVGVYDVINLGKEGFNVVRELNTALTEMRKVSDETVQSLKDYQATTFDTADAVGTTAKQIQNSTADWMRLGESMNQAAESAKDANVLLNVSEFEGIDEATESLVSMSQAYKDLDKMDIIDVLNNIGNNYSISTDGLATALKDSASALVTANNDLNEAVSLTTAGNAITQDPSKVGAGLRTISLRLVGTEEAKQELSDLGEETDGMITTVSKLRDTIMDATKAASSDGKGFDILDSNGNYKSTYEIMQGLADLYDNIVKKDKELGTNNLNLLLETIAGKNRANIAASILQNGDMLRSVYKDAQNSEGSAEKELNSYLDSIDGKMAQLENRAQEFWFKVIDSETIKNGIDLLSTLLKGTTDFVDTVGLLPTILTGIGAALSFKNVGILELN